MSQFLTTSDLLQLWSDAWNGDELAMRLVCAYVANN